MLSILPSGDERSSTADGCDPLGGTDKKQVVQCVSKKIKNIRKLSNIENIKTIEKVYLIENPRQQQQYY